MVLEKKKKYYHGNKREGGEYNLKKNKIPLNLPFI